MDRRTKLFQAAAMLSEVIADLDQTSAACTTCGLNVKHNFVEAQVAAQLTSMRDKLKRFAGQLDGAEQQPDGGQS